jgi:hypothetical protein
LVLPPGDNGFKPAREISSCRTLGELFVMKSKILAACALSVLAMAVATASADVVYDHFDAASLDMSKWNLESGAVAPTLASSVATFDSSNGTESILSTAGFGTGTYTFKLGATTPSGNGYMILGLGNGNNSIMFRNDYNAGWEFVMSKDGVASRSGALAAPGANDVYDIVWTSTLAELVKNNSTVLASYSTGIPTVASMNMQLTSFLGGVIGFDYVGTKVVPEPSALILLATGLLGLLAYVWRKRK